MTIPTIENIIVGFAIIFFVVSWIRHGFSEEKITLAIKNGVTAANFPIGIIMLAVALGLLDPSILTLVFSNIWILFYAGAFLFASGIVVIFHNK